jgi:hypothetical protein
MNKYKKQKSAEEKFKDSLSESMAMYHRNILSENVKRGMRLKKIRNFELKFGLDKNESLGKEFIERVRVYKSKIKEVETSTLEETLDSFKRDLYPQKELKVWEEIANYYSSKVKDNPKMSLSEKRSLFTEALTWTLG